MWRFGAGEAALAMRVIADAVAARLRKEGFAVETAVDGPGGVELCPTQLSRVDPPSKGNHMASTQRMTRTVGANTTN